MSTTAESDANQTPRTSGRKPVAQGQDFVRILFIHRTPANVERCLHELLRMRFKVCSEVVLTPEQFAERLGKQTFDIAVAEYPSPYWEEAELIDILRQTKRDVPLLFLAHGVTREIAVELMVKGATDCIEMNSEGHLSLAVHRALAEKALRHHCDRAAMELRRSEARYRALAGNLSYGICHCSLDGKLLEVNETMMKMLGYGSRKEILTQFPLRDIIQDHGKRTQLLGQPEGDAVADPLEIEWKRKDDAALKVRLSGREVRGDRDELEAYELIAEDITKQRELEEHLRRQAVSDPLTGLANYRGLVGVLDSEIKRSKRTGREFALLFFDVNGLKLINNLHGHLIGSQALCRLADVLCSSCRDIDTPARFGGDEFVAVLPETKVQEAYQTARRICEIVATDAKGPQLSVSAGVAVYPQNAKSMEGLLCEADSNLYSMKRQKMCRIESGRSHGAP
jgi:two-component system cell cycle response regulator